jgi:hypothetical protein
MIYTKFVNSLYKIICILFINGYKLNMGIRKIKYKGKTVKVIWKHCVDCYAKYEPSKKLLTIHPEQSNLNLAKTLIHELFHIICDFNNIDINKIGEEKTAKLTEQYIVIFKNNPHLKKLVNELY